MGTTKADAASPSFLGGLGAGVQGRRVCLGWLKVGEARWETAVGTIRGTPTRFSFLSSLRRLCPWAMVYLGWLKVREGRGDHSVHHHSGR